MKLILPVIILWVLIMGSVFTAYTTWRQALGDGRFMWVETNKLIIYSEAVIFRLAIPSGLYLIWRVLRGSK